MIHDIAIGFTFCNLARSPAKIILIRINGETIRVEPGHAYGPVWFFLEENELILFQSGNGIAPLTLQWTENNKLVPVDSSDWKNSSKGNVVYFEFSRDALVLTIRYHLKVKSRKTITLKFSAHARCKGIDTV